jgi:4-oxalocrotonate tautomerase
MAIVTVRLIRGEGAAAKRKLVEALTAALADTLEIPRANIVILIEEYERENWANAGELNSDRPSDNTVVDLEAIFRKPDEKPRPPKKPAKATPRKAPAKSRSRR